MRKTVNRGEKRIIYFERVIIRCHFYGTTSRETRVDLCSLNYEHAGK